MMDGRLIDHVRMVVGCPPAALTGAAGDGDYVSLKNYRKLRVTLAVLNGSTVSGGAVTFKQASAVAGTGEKALAFTRMWANTDCATADTLTETTVTNNTFTTDTTNSKQLLYVIEIDISDLDINNGFYCVRVDVANMANAVGTVLYDLYDCRESPFAVSAITD